MLIIFGLTMGVIWLAYSSFSRRSVNVRMLRAAERGDQEGVKAAIANGADINAQDRHGLTVFEWAAYEGDVKTVNALLGSRSAMTDRTVGAGFGMAAWRGRSVIVERFIRAGIPPDHRDELGMTPLMYACKAPNPDRKGALACASILLAAGADVNARADGGGTALSIAEALEFKPMVRLLRKHAVHSEGYRASRAEGSR